MIYKKIAALLAVSGIAAPAFATNGMNLEGYGPIATGMGGASMAYDNGTAAVANNPATLGLMPAGSMRLDVAVGVLGPDVNSSMTGFGNAPSSGDMYLMPAIGFVARTGKFTYGAGVFAQGGMGTEYGTSSFLSMGSGKEVRSELGVGRAIFPLAYTANDALTIGGSLDLVWAGLDVRMPMSLAAMGNMMTPGGGTMGSITVTPTMGGALNGMMMTGTAYGGYFDFSNGNDFTGKANATGWAGKIGFTYKVSPQLTIGGVYQTKTKLDDLETDSNASLSVLDTAGNTTLSGKIKVKNFQWPETYGFGMAYQATDKLLIAADYKRINWSKVMKNFTMEFSPNAMPGESMTATLYQNWSDQDVIAAGVTYGVTDALKVRLGFNYAKNPIPSSYLNALFPAIQKTHYTFGVGYAFTKAADLNFSMTYAPEVSQTNSSPAAIGGGVTSTMSQLNWQLMYSHRF